MKNNTIKNWSKKIRKSKKIQKSKKFESRKKDRKIANFFFWLEVLVDEAEGRDAYVGRRPSEGEALATWGEGAVGTPRRVHWILA